MSRSTKETVAVTGGSGFIGGHLIKRLVRKEKKTVIAIDQKKPEFENSIAHELLLRDLSCERVFFNYAPNEVYNLAASTGGIEYICSNVNTHIMAENARINLNVLDCAINGGAKKILFTSSACAIQPDTGYGWEKLFSELVYESAAKEYGIQTRIARLYNTFGPQGPWFGGRESAPAALCRKVAEAKMTKSNYIEIIGDGTALRSLLYVDDCVDALVRLMKSDYRKPINIGSEEVISIKDLALKISHIAGWPVEIRHIPGPVGVPSRNSDSSLAKEVLNWEPKTSLEEGLTETYYWIENQIMRSMNE